MEKKKKLAGFDVDAMWDYENGYFTTSHVKRLSKVLAQYDLYKSIVNLPGHIVECGVYKGSSLIRFATFREIMENPYSRKVIGFDIFGKFPEQDEKHDKAFIEKFEGIGGLGNSKSDMEAIFEYKGFVNYELIDGDITVTIPGYIEKHPELKIALLHIDVDVYHPTVTILNDLYDKVVKGGLIVLDDYGTVAGETKAVDEFLQSKDILIQKLSVSHIPAYIKKNE